MSETAPYFLVDSDQTENLSKLGAKGRLLSGLMQKNIPLATTLIIPPQILFEILDYNHLLKPIKQISSLIDWQDQTTIVYQANLIRNRVQKATLPEEMVIKLAKAYHQYFPNQFVKVKALSTSPTSEEVVKGETNLILAILGTLANQFRPEDLQQTINNIATGAISLSPILIQASSPSHISGVAFSKHPTRGQKNIVHIRSGWGLGHNLNNYHQLDETDYDLYQQKVVQTKPKTKLTYQTFNDHNLVLKNLKSYQQKAHCLDENTASQIALLTNTIKRSTPSHIAVEWTINNNMPIVTDIHDLDDHQAQINVATSWVGKCLVPGLTTGTIINSSQFEELSKFINPILVTDNLNPQVLPYLNQLSGLIIRQIPTNLVLSMLEEILLPTLLIAQKSSRLPASGSMITLDSTLSKAYSVYPDLNSSVQSKPIRHQILSLAGNPATITLTNAQPNDGLFFSSRKIWQEINIHPQELIEKNQQSRFVLTALELIEQYLTADPELFIYQSISFSSAEMAQFKHGQNHEQAEDNPEMGFRGSLRLLSRPAMIQMELELLAQIAKKFSQPIYWNVGFIRSSSEAVILARILDQFNQNHSTQIKFSLEIDNPINLFTLDELLACHPSLIVINAKQLYANSLNYDIYNQELANTYFIKADLLAKMVKLLVRNQSDSTVPVLFLLDKPDPNLIEHLQQLVDGFIVAPQNVEPTKMVLSKL